MSLFARRSISVLLDEAQQTGQYALKKSPGAGNLIALGIGAVIGAGLFSITGMAAANHTGPAITISFAVAAISCVFAGLCYAEFASTLPVSGSAYTYSYANIGEFVAWIIGQDLLLFMLFVSLFIAFVPARVVGERTSIGTLFAFILVCISILIMRRKMPELPRAFKTPMVPFVPITGVAVCLFMMVFCRWTRGFDYLFGC